MNDVVKPPSMKSLISEEIKLLHYTLKHPKITQVEFKEVLKALQQLNKKLSK